MILYILFLIWLLSKMKNSVNRGEQKVEIILEEQ